MKKTFLIVLILTALFMGSMLCIQAQNKKRESPKERMERIKREKAAKDSLSTASYKREVENLEKEKFEVIAKLQASANEKAEVERKLANSEKVNSELKNQIDASKTDVDTLLKQLLATKMILMQKEQQDQVDAEKDASPVISVIQENPVPVDSTKKDSVKVKKVVTHTRVLATMVKGDTAFVPVKDKKLVPIQKKGTIIILAEGDPVENIARIRKSDVEKNQAKIDELIGLGYTLEEVNK